MNADKIKIQKTWIDGANVYFDVDFDGELHRFCYETDKFSEEQLIDNIEATKQQIENKAKLSDTDVQSYKDKTLSDLTK